MLTALRRARNNLSLNHRADATELLDGNDLSTTEIARNLADLARLNRLPGGVRASIAGIRRLLDGEGDARILDAGTGRGDMPIGFARRGWSTVAVDTHPEVLSIARRATATEQRIEVVEADARSLPFADVEFDVSHCSLLMHHLDPGEAVDVLRELRRVARGGVVINDLRRGLIPLVGTSLSVVAVGGSRVTRHDGMISARRAYTLAELDELVGEAGLAVRWRSPWWLPRVVTATTPITAR
ncbi:MAG: methyltransferase domain-containing protein [Chloroflexota bacterium]|nr:methyltransferase domain-containing protein [Chloroflexota bacterium]